MSFSSFVLYFRMCAWTHVQLWDNTFKIQSTNVTLSEIPWPWLRRSFHLRGGIKIILLKHFRIGLANKILKAIEISENLLINRLNGHHPCRLSATIVARKVLVTKDWSCLRFWQFIDRFDVNISYLKLKTALHRFT